MIKKILDWYYNWRCARLCDKARKAAVKAERAFLDSIHRHPSI